MKQVSKEIHNHLLLANKIVVVPHQNPDADAIGSAVAITEYLLTLGKKPSIFCPVPPQKKLSFLAHLEKIKDDVLVFEGADTIIVLDSGDLKYAGVAEYTENHPATIINIDHHHTNERYGKYNLVIPGASATTEVLYHFFKYNNFNITSRAATALLAGIITDTGNFSNGGTTTSSLLVASELLRRGANLNLIHNSVTKNKPVKILRLWGEVLSRLQKNEEKNLAHTYITLADLEKYQADESEVEGISNFLNNLYETKITLLLRETKEGKIKGSFRTTLDGVDVASLAKKMGGGGHKKAAGFTADGTVQEVLEKILKME